MPGKRPPPQPDAIITARLFGAAHRHVPAGWRDPEDAETEAAAAELREIAGGRADLLAEVAGLLMGTPDGDPYERRQQIAARYLIAAGAGEEAIMPWITEGLRRAEVARKNRPRA